MSEHFVLVTPGSDGPEPCPPEYEPVGLHKSDEPDGWDDIPWGDDDDEDWGDEEGDDGDN